MSQYRILNRKINSILGFFIVILFFAISFNSIIYYSTIDDFKYSQGYVLGTEEYVLNLEEDVKNDDVLDEYGWPLCDNYEDIIDFENPEQVIWLAKLDGCLGSCQGGFFTRVDQNVKYPRFTAYLPADEYIPLKILEDSNVTIKITGKLISIGDDHYRTIFDNKCVPTIDIDKIEVVE